MVAQLVKNSPAMRKTCVLALGGEDPLEKGTATHSSIGTMDWFQIEKGVHQGCILSLCLFNLYAEYITQNARLDEAQAGIKIWGKI